MSRYKIYTMFVGRFRGYEKSWLLYNTCCGEPVDAMIFAYLIQGEGKNILVDTGCGSSETAEKNGHFKLSDASDITAELKKLGVAPKDIDCIIQTHLHWDCCQGNDLFKNANIYVQKKELPYAIKPFPCQYEEYETAHVGCSYPWVNSMDRFVYLDGDAEILPGLKALLLSGHSPGFQGVVVNTDKGKCLIAGDSVPLYENWTGVKGNKHIPSAIHVNTADCLNSFDKIKGECDMIIAGRDSRVAGGVCLVLDKGGGYEFGNI